MIPVLDMVLLILVAYLAFTNAGTFIGWMLTVAVFLQTFLIIKFIRDN